MAVVYDLAGALVGALFTATSAGKWMNLRWFFHVIAQYGVVPVPLVPAVAVVVTATESTIGILLLTGVSQREAALCAAVMIVAFTIVMGVHLLRGKPPAQCGCTGRPGEVVTAKTLARNLFVLGLAAMAVRSSASTGAALAYGAVAFILLMGSLWMLRFVGQLRRHVPA